MKLSRRILFALFLLAAALALRAPYLSRKIFNTDEGSTFTFAQQVLAGDVLYRDSADIRLPLLPYLKAAVLAVAGDWNIPAVRIAWALALGVMAIGLWRIARRLGDETAGVGAALAFTVLAFAMLERMEGFALHTEWCVVGFSIAGFALFARAAARGATAWGGLGSGALFALATLGKQPGLLDFLVSLVLTVLLLGFRRGERAAWGRFAAAQIAGYLAVLGAVTAYFATQGALRDFVYYTWTYNHSMYVPEQSETDRVGAILGPLRLMRDQAPALLGLGLAGAAGLLWIAGRDCVRRTATPAVLAWLVLGWSASGLVASTLSGRGFSHYAIQALPGFSLACGWAAARAIAWAGHGGRARIAAVAAGLAALAAVTAWQVARRYATFTTRDDFTPEHAQLVDAFTRPDERILVWGFFPEFYAHVRRLPATKFICTNFLTGQIPWTNLDSLVDTSYAIVPGAPAEFAAELRRQPPALLVDIGQMRGYLKYPILRQPALGAEIVARYARIQPERSRNSGFTYYRRTADIGDETQAANVPEAADVTLTPGLPPDEFPVPRLRVRAPAGTTRVDLFRDGKLVRRLEQPAALACDAEFLLAESERTGRFRAVVRRGAASDAAVQSGEVDLGAFLAAEAAKPVAGPALRFAGRDYAPLAGAAYQDTIHRLDGEDRWLAHAPSFLKYARPAGLTRLRLEYGLHEEVYFPTKHHGASNGIDVAVDFVHADDGRTERLFARRLEPASNGQHQGPQLTEVKLPGDAGGTIVLRMLPGGASDPVFDWAYWKTIDGSAPQPRLRFGERRFDAVETTAAGQPTLPDLGNDRWLIHPPARVVYPAAELAGARRLEFDYGLEPKTYDGSGDGLTDGVTLRVLLERDGEPAEELFARALDPVAREADRGTLHADLPLPARPFARLIFLTDHGPKNNPAYDWSWFGRLRAKSD